MRNLKRALSLTLASVMLLGMMVVGSSAAGYSDVDENDNVEAIEVLQAVEVMVGDDRGFGPDRPVTRNEMAVVMGKLLNLNYNYYSSTCPFTDVADWAKGWVGACAANGIVSGRGNGIYDGESTVTAIEAASMMMRALGYFKNTEDYADGFQVVTVRQGSQIGIFNMVGTDANTPMTRNQVAQMALNALRSEIVDFTGTPGIEVNGVKVGYKAEYTPRTSTEAKYNAIEGRTSDVASDLNHKGQYYIQLGEQLYDGDLRLDNDATDVFGRPSRQWDYKGDEIGTYAKRELMRKDWTVEVEGGDVYTGVGAAASEDYTLFYWVDGVRMSKADTATEQAKFERRNDDTVGTTGNGVLTEAYVNVDDEELTIVEIHTYLAYATNDYNSRNDKLSINIYESLDTDSTPADENLLTRTLSGEDFDIDGYKQDDLMLVTFAGTKREVQSVSEPQKVADVYVNSYSTGENKGDSDDYMMSSLTADGTKYNASYDAVWDAEYLYDYNNKDSELQMKDHRYNLYLDQYGYVIGLENIKATTNYAFLIGYQPGSDVLAKATDKALVILIDEETGTADMKVVTADRSDLSVNDNKQLFGSTPDYENSSINKWITYTMDGSTMVLKTTVDEQYQQTYTTGDEIDRDSVTLEGSLLDAAADTFGGANTIKYGNTKTIYVSVDADDSVDAAGSIVEINGTSVGVRNTHIEFTNPADAKGDGTNVNVATNVNGAYVLFEEDSSYIKYAVVLGENSGNQDLVYLTKQIGRADRDDEKDKDVYIYEGFVNGKFEEEIESLVRKDNTANKDELVTDVLYEARFNSDGRIIRMTPKAENWSGATNADNRDDGYVHGRIAAIKTTNGAAGTLTGVVADGTGEKLWLKDQTLYINDDSTNANYFQLDDNVKFYVKSVDENGKWVKGGYVEYTSASSALAALGKKQTAAGDNGHYLFTGAITAICDPATGFATTVIIRDAIYEHDDLGGGGDDGRSIEGVMNGGTIAATAADTLKNLPSGGYIFNNKPTTPNDVNGNAKDNMYFLTKTDGSQSFSATLTIKNSKGDVVYKEYTADANAAYKDNIKTPYFYVQLIGTGISNKAAGYELSDTALKTGTYTWTITGSNIEAVEGSFEIE